MLEALGAAAIRTLLLACVVHLVVSLLRVQRSHSLICAWTLVLAASLLMPALQLAAPLLLPIIPELPVIRPDGMSLLPWPYGAVEPTVAGPSTGDGGPLTPGSLLPAIYLSVSGALLLRLVVGVLLSLRLLLRATPIRLKGSGGVRVRISPEIAAPVTFGAVVLLPSDAPAWPRATLEAVMAHERAHVERWDFALLLASQLHRAVFWFSPLSWWLHRRLSSLAELASDDRAIQLTGDRPGYAAVLLEMGRRSGPLLRGLAMARPVTLHHRIERTLTGKTRPGPPRPVQQLGLVAIVAGLSFAAAGIRLDPGPGAMRPSQNGSPATDRPGIPPAAGTALSGASLDGAASIAARLGEPLPGMPDAVSVLSGVQVPRERAPRPGTASPLQAAASNTGPVIARAVDRRTAREASIRSAHSPAASAPLVHASMESPAITIPLQSRQRAQDAVVRPAGSQANGVARAQPVGDMPSCTGRYFPKQGPSPDGEQLELIDARYLRSADGTEALRFLLGVRARVRLTGMDVERTSVRATVVARLRDGTSHLSGETTGLTGTLNYRCQGLRT